MSVCLVQAMCALLQCGPVFDRNGLITGGYLYNWLQLVLNSPKEKVSLVTRCCVSVVFEMNGVCLRRGQFRGPISNETLFFYQIHQLGHSTLVHLLENNGNIPSLLHWVIDKCYTGSRLVVNGCFKALVSVFTKR